MDIQGKTFMITGGASGLGEATARLLAASGGNVVVMDLNEEKGEALAEELGAQGRFAKTDVTDPAHVQGAIDVAKEAFGAIDGVVNCAGVGSAAKTVSRRGPYPLDLFQIVVNVNLIGTFNVIRLAAAAMADVEGPQPTEDRGVIVNTASAAAFDGQIGQAAYSASKGGVVGMTLPIARDLARYGIRVVTIAPGLFDTPMLAALPEAAKASLGAQVPFPPRLGTSEEFASLVKQIVENPMLNGETIRLDGAIRMAPK